MTNPTLTGQDEARRALTVDQQKLLDALTYFRPHWATNDPVMLTPDKMREHLAVIESTLRHFAEIALRVPSLDRGAEEMRERAAKVCEDEATACLGDIALVAARFPEMQPDERGDSLAHARASSLLDAAGDIRALPAAETQPALARRAEEMEDRLDRYEDALHDIQRWSEAYPLSVFPEPDLKKARALLEAGGMTLDSISAYCMRHVVEGVGKIACRALPVPADLNEGGGK